MTENSTSECDGTCHDITDDCPRCGSGEWHLMCEDCRSYAAQDADPVAAS
jgi:hypothetical protein